jgi:hypothetical protein
LQLRVYNNFVPSHLIGISLYTVRREIQYESALCIHKRWPHYRKNIRRIRSIQWDGKYSTRAHYAYINDGRSTAKI